MLARLIAVAAALLAVACAPPQALQCSSGTCVEGSGAQRCAEACGGDPGLDAGICPDGEVCTLAVGCCNGGHCSGFELYVCCPPSGC
jgi:hypothetical protein